MTDDRRHVIHLSDMELSLIRWVLALASADRWATLPAGANKVHELLERISHQ